MQFLKRFSSELVAVDVGCGTQVMSARSLRKDGKCKGCGTAIPKGARAFGEVKATAMNRKDRFCFACVELSERLALR